MGDNEAYQISSVGKIKFVEMEDEYEKKIKSDTDRNHVGEKNGK